MFIARPASGPTPRRDLHLVRSRRRSFTGPARFLADPRNRARVVEYLTDMTRPYGVEVPAEPFGEPPSPHLGHSYGEMAEPLIEAVVPPDEPVDLLVLAFSGHDLRPGRPTAAYLSDLTPGSPMAFAVCDQGSAAAFTGLRIIREYASSAGIRRALLIVVEQAAIPYHCPAPVPSRHRGIAMLYGVGTPARARVTDIRQHPGVPPDRVAGLAAGELARLTADRPKAALVLGDSLGAAAMAPAATPVRVIAAGQPATGVWWGVIDELEGNAGEPFAVVAADYDPDLRYLCLIAFEKENPQWETR